MIISPLSLVQDAFALGSIASLRIAFIVFEILQILIKQTTDSTCKTNARFSNKCTSVNTHNCVLTVEVWMLTFISDEF